jgi:O-antigen ligase
MAVASSPYLKQTQASNVALMLGIAGLVAFGAACGVALAMGEMQALYVSLALIACIAILVDYRIGPVLLILMLPVSYTAVFPHQLMGITGLNPVNVLIVGTLAAYILRGRMENVRALVPLPLLWMYVLPIVVGGLLGMDNVDDISPSFHETLAIEFFTPMGYLRDMVVKPMLLVVGSVLVAAAVAKADKPERFITAIALSAVALAFVEFAFLLVSQVHLGMLASPKARTFFSGISMHANTLGRIFVTAYALLLFVWWEARRPSVKMALFVALGILSFAILFTFSRNAWLGFFVVNGLFLMWKFNAKKLVLALGGLVVAAVLAPEYVYRRLTYGFDTGDANVVSAGRVDGIWLPLLPEVWKSPLWGNGLGSTMWSTPMEQGAMELVGHPHNAFLESLLDVGIIGLVLMCLFYWKVWRGWLSLGSNVNLSPELRAFFQGACAAMIAFGVACMTGGSLRPITENTILWITIGMMYGMLARKPAA